MPRSGVRLLEKDWEERDLSRLGVVLVVFWLLTTLRFWVVVVKVMAWRVTPDRVYNTVSTHKNNPDNLHLII